MTPLASLAQALVPSRGDGAAVAVAEWLREGPIAPTAATVAAGRAGEGAIACSSIGGVCGARWAAAVACAADVERPPWTHDVALCTS